MIVTDRIDISKLEIANIFNSYFSNILKNLITQPHKSSFDPSIKMFKVPLQLSIEKYENHKSINLIKDMMRNLDNPTISFVQTLSETQKINPKKAAPVKNIRKNKDLLKFYIHHKFRIELLIKNCIIR